MATAGGICRDTTDSLLVAAIDFGTAYSGWAFSFKHEYDSDPTRISSKQWYGGHNVSLKAPTTVLIQPDGLHLEAFGYDAENRYAELAAENKHRKYYYFKHFKMMLYERLGLSRNTVLEDDKGLNLLAKTVFSLAIRFLKDDLMKTCASRLTTGSVEDGDVHWVLTVPAIWNDAAKQFMREAAVEAGIQTCNLSIALEPEAASLFCRILPVEKLVGGRENVTSVAAFKPGSRYMVLDAGGGTVDITVHQVMEGGRLRELRKASGGAWGGTKVDESFRQLLIKIVGLPVLLKFQEEYADDYLDIFREFELKKRETGPDKESKITIRIPTGLKDVLVRETDLKDLKEAIQQTSMAEYLSIAGDKLRIDPSVCKDLFKKAVNSIVEHVKALLDEPETQDPSAILMVGGFSESPMLQHAVKLNFPRMKLVIPEEAGLVVLKGAVVFGHNPACIAERVCKYTYGIRTCANDEFNTHDRNKRFKTEDGKWKCKDIFDRHVQISQTVKYGEPQAEIAYVPISEFQTYVSFPIYASSSLSPIYVTDHGSILLGSVSAQVLDMSVPLSKRTMTVSFTFSGTEIEVKAKEKRTGNVTSATVNFLG